MILKKLGKLNLIDQELIAIFKSNQTRTNEVDSSTFLSELKISNQNEETRNKSHFKTEFIAKSPEKDPPKNKNNRENSKTKELNEQVSPQSLKQKITTDILSQPKSTELTIELVNTFVLLASMKEYNISCQALSCDSNFLYIA